MTESHSSNLKLFDVAAAAELLGPPVVVDENTVSRAMDEGTCSTMAFDLYKEATTVVIVSAHLTAAGSGVLDRNQAICVGLLVRVGKFMTAVMQLAQDDRREVVMSLERSILESAINVRFLLTKNSSGVFDSFVRAALGPERELYDTIRANIEARGGERLPIEKRMLWSIERVVRLSGLSIDEIGSKRQEWGGSLRERMKAIDEEYMYLFGQRIPSHAVHGSWVDLLLHHLREQDDGFVADAEWKSVDARLLNPTALFVLGAVGQYLEYFYAQFRDVDCIKERVVDLAERLQKADAAHEEWMQKREQAEVLVKG